MKILIKNGHVYHNHRMEDTDVLFENGKIKAVGNNLTTKENDAEVYDASGSYVVPGFIDIHTHGAVGVDVNAATAEDFEKICCFFATQGTTNWLCSVLTDTKEQTLWCIDQYKKWRKLEHKGAELMGIHLEGPFLNAEYKGAMPEYLLLKPDMELLKEYQEAAEGNIRYITVSPEIEGMLDFIPEIKSLGIQVAIGHSGADYETARKAIANGAMGATHTGNAMKLLHQHFPAIWGAVLEDNDIFCEMICDGRHLHPGTIRLTIKAKGLSKVIAITDSIMAAGLPDGNYKLGVNDVVVIDGDAKLISNGTRAGSTLTTGKALKNLVEFTGRPLCDILPMFSENPAKLLGIDDKLGNIRPGNAANVVILDKNYSVVKTFVNGK